jgi:DNA segregation ATPase FtsK/SpoIIIE, S-DNA-T family
MTDTSLETSTHDSPSGLIVPIGVDKSGGGVSLDLPKLGSLLISHPEWMTIDTSIICKILDTVTTMNKPDELKLIICDVCNAGLTSYDGDEHLLTPVITPYDRVIASHMWAVKEINNRMKLLNEYGASNIEEYNKVAGFTAMNYLLIVDVDISEVVKFVPSKIYDLVCNIMEHARETGVVLVATTKHPRDSMSKLFETKISYKGNDEVGVVNYQSTDSDSSEKITLSIS